MISREELIHFKIGYINHVYTPCGGVREITYVGSETPFSEELTMAKAVDSLSELERPSPRCRHPSVTTLTSPSPSVSSVNRLLYEVGPLEFKPQAVSAHALPWGPRSPPRLNAEGVSRPVLKLDLGQSSNLRRIRSRIQSAGCDICLGRRNRPSTTQDMPAHPQEAYEPPA